MADYKVRQGNIFGRIGSGIGQGLAESFPKEFERGRLSQGLQQFEQEAANLTPIQQLARLSSIPGITPQMVQSFGELARQQARGQALKEMEPKPPEPQPSPFPIQGVKKEAQGAEIPSITKEKPLEKIQEGYIPPTQEEVFQYAGELYNSNPALYGNDPQKAIQAAEDAAMRQQKISEAYQRQHENLTAIQDNVVNRLQKHSEGLGVRIPPDLYSKIEDKAIDAVKPKAEGGKGLTEQQAMKESGKELDDASRDYDSIKGLGGWGLLLSKPSETIRSINSLQDKFEKRNDTENFAKRLQSELNLSPVTSFALAEPVRKIPELRNYISNLPEVARIETMFESALSPDARQKTIQISPKLAEIVKNKEASPLAVAFALDKKGYDSSVWLDYLFDHREELDLKESKARQLDNRREALTKGLNDWWLTTFSGMD